MTRAEKNRQSAIEAAIAPIVGTPSLEATDMPRDLNGLRHVLLTFTTRLTASEQQVACVASYAEATQAALDKLTARFRTLRRDTPAVAIGGTMVVAVTWPTAFPDAKYNVVVTLEGAGLLGLTAIVTNRTATGCTVSVKNVLGVTLLAGAGTLHMNAIHDQP